MSIEPFTELEYSPEKAFEQFGFALSEQSGPCSVAASEACKDTAEYLISQAGTNKDLQVIDDLNDDSSRIFNLVRTKRNRDINDYDDLIDINFDNTDILVPAVGNPIELVYVRETRKIASSNEVSQPKIRFPLKLLMQPSRTDSEQQVKNEIIGKPKLAALIENEILLPLAAFGRTSRKGKCDFVQIGSEMYDDNFYSTVADDETSRFHLIEAFRKLVPNDGAYKSPLDVAERNLILNLINHEVGRYQEQFDKAIEGYFIRKCSELINESSEAYDLLVVDEQDTLHSQALYAHTLMPAARTDSGRPISLVIAAPDKSPNNMQLLAVSRGNLAIRLATLSKDSNTVDFNRETNELNPDLKRQRIHSLLVLIRQGLVKCGSNSEDKSIEIHRDIHDDDIRAQVAATELGIFKRHGPGDCSKYSLEKIEQAVEAVPFNEYTVAPLELSLLFPGFYEFPDTSLTIQYTIREQEKLRNKRQRQILQMLEASSHFDELTGETNIALEALLTKLYLMKQKGNLFTGVLEDIPIEKTRGDAYLTIELKESDGIYQVIFWGRSNAEAEDDYKEVDRLDVNITCPLQSNNENLLRKAPYFFSLLDAVDRNIWD